MKRQVQSGDWGSSAAWGMALKQKGGGGVSRFMEGISDSGSGGSGNGGGSGGWGVLMAPDAGNEGVDGYAGVENQVRVTGRRDGADRRRKKITENTAEKKHKRMVKNRESAARSRARKQAYTSQLEYEIVTLKKENQLLMKYELFEKMTASLQTGCPEPLRRTFSATF